MAVNFRMVRLGRELRDVNQTLLARRSGVAQAVLSRIESGLRPATDVEHDAIARALDLPPAFFLEPDTPAAAPLFRKRAIRSVRANRLIQARVNTAVLAARRIFDAGVEFDTPFTFPAPGEFPRDDPAGAAATLRRAWRLPNGRIDSVTNIIEDAGGIVLQVDFGSDDASAAFVASTPKDPRLWFLINTRERAGDRARLSLAHELGHAILHRYLLVDDESRLEPEAYEFAIALLVPPDAFSRSADRELTLARARDLKRAYRVSIQALVRAAATRGVISPERYTSLYKQISARGWRRDEPDPIPVEAPTTWPDALTVHRDEHGYDVSELGKIARLSEDDLRDLFPRDFTPRLRVLAGGTGRAPTHRGQRRRAMHDRLPGA